MERIETVQQFQEKINRDQLTVIKFFADWCPDCRNLNGFIDEIIAEHPDKDWYEVNVESLAEIAEQYEVRGIPSLLVFKNGEKIAHLHSRDAKTPGQVRDFLASVKA